VQVKPEQRHEAETLTFQKNLGAKVRVLRLKAGYSQEDFADACGLHRTHISMVERGTLDLKMSTIRKMAVVLKMSLSELLEGL